MTFFSLTRTSAVLVKEFIQMKRDRLTFAMIVGIPVIQLLLFGFAINLDPKHLPTALLVQDSSPYVRTLIVALENTGYFDIVAESASEAEADRALARGEVAFVIQVPPDFTRKLLRGERPQILIAADATDPAAASQALAAVNVLAAAALRPELDGALSGLNPAPPPFEPVIHRRYNPEGITQHNIVPGLLGVILTMTMALITAISVTRETERGTMENLLAMPLLPSEVMVGKIVPYILVGAVQVLVVLAAAWAVFDVPFVGPMQVLAGALALFIALNLAIGFTISTLAANQMQAMQMTFFFFLPSILLSGFMFPFRGMPVWAQAIGEALPLTHMLRLVRGVLLKGNGWADSAPHVWPLLAILAVVSLIAMRRYRRTLD